MLYGRPATEDTGSCYYIIDHNTLREEIGTKVVIYHRTGK